MNIYGVIALILALIIFAYAFGVVEPISQFIHKIADIPTLDDTGNNPALYKLAVRLAYLIVIVAVIKLLLTRNKEE